MLDYQTIYEVGMARRDDLLREAAANMRASQVPSGRSALRTTLSGWLYALADKLEQRAYSDSGDAGVTGRGSLLLFR